MTDDEEAVAAVDSALLERAMQAVLDADKPSHRAIAHVEPTERGGLRFWFTGMELER